jgi:anti-sigma factor RsiW
MTCRELVEVVTDYLEGDLPSTERARFEAHLAQCPHCVDYVEQMRLTVAALGHLSEESLSPAARTGLLAAFRDWRGPS